VTWNRRGYTRSVEDRKRDRRLIQIWWAKPELTLTEIAQRLGLERTGVSRTAARLGLPPRDGRLRSREKQHLQAEERGRLVVQQVNAMLAQQVPPGTDRPVCRVCAAPCPADVDGHDACVGRGWKPRAA
jgi:hypothetical protein